MQELAQLVAGGDLTGALAAATIAPVRTAREEILVAHLLLATGRLPTALVRLEGVLQRPDLEPREAAEAYLALALASAQLQDPSAQREHLQRAVELDPTLSDAWAALGALHQATDELVEALASFNRALEADPGSLQGLLGVSSILLTREEPEQALPFLDRAVEVEPDYPWTFVDRARARTTTGDIPGAIADYGHAIELQPAYPWHYLDRGRLRFGRGEYDGTIADMSKTLEADPRNLSALVYRGRAALALRHYSDALRDFEQVGAIRPDYVFAYPLLGILYYIDGQWAASRASLEQAYAEEPTEHAYGLLVGLTHVMAGDQAAARSHLQALLPRLPRLPADHWYRRVGRYLLDRGASINSVLELARGNVDRARASFYLGQVELHDGRPRTALALLLDSVTRAEGDFLEKHLAEWVLARSQEETDG